jgi:hypothetical protein
VIDGFPPSPNPATDYDGFIAGTDEDNDTRGQAAPPRTKGARSGRDTKGRAGQTSLDQEDEALKGKLTICQNCK